MPEGDSPGLLLPLFHYYHKTAAFFMVANQLIMNWTPQAFEPVQVTCVYCQRRRKGLEV